MNVNIFQQGAFLTIIATFMQTFSPNGKLGAFIAGRVVIGLGQGIALSECSIIQPIFPLILIGAIASGPVYIGELAPVHIRGKIMTFWQMFYSVGSFIAYWIDYACSARNPITNSAMKNEEANQSNRNMSKRSENGTGRWSSYSKP